MKLRLDLLNAVTLKDVMAEALHNQHRYSAEPRFSKTGVGSLSPTSIEDYAKEAKRSTDFVKRIKKRSTKAL
jgi:hypothetical protein